MATEKQLVYRVDSPTACPGTIGTYAAMLYHMDAGRRFIVPTQVDLGRFKEGYDEPFELLEKSRRLAEKKAHQVIPLEACIALNAVRMCTRQKHIDGIETAGDSGTRLERVAALAIVQDPQTNVRIRPFSVEETQELKKTRGVGHARRHEAYLASLPVVSVPLTREESRSFMVVDAVRAAAPARTLSQKAHVVLHRHGTAETLEQIVTLDDLQ